MQTKQMRSGREEVNVWIPKLTKQTCGIAETCSGLLPLLGWCLTRSPATPTSRVMPEQHGHSVVVSCLHFRVVFPVTNVDPATEHFASVCVFALLWKQQRCHLPRWAGGANAGAWVQLLWEHLALAGCAGRGWVPSQTHLLPWRLDVPPEGMEAEERLQVHYFLTSLHWEQATTFQLPSVVFNKKLAWFILEVTVFMVCMSVKSPCSSWGSKNPRAYQYYCIHSSLTRTEQ